MNKTAGQDRKDEDGAAGKAAQALHPFLLHSAAAFAAATAVGIGIQTQIAGAVLGLMEGAFARTGSGDNASGNTAAAEAEAPVVTEPVKAAPAIGDAAAVRPQEAPKAKAERAVGASKAKMTPRARTVSDDLKRIAGVGPKLEQVLNARGIRRFADIAAWSEADVERFDAELGMAGRIGRDDWIGQAKALAGSAKSRK